MTKSIIGVSNSKIFEQIANNLSEGNLYLEVEDGNTRMYRLMEYKSQDTINLQNLTWWISEKLDMNPKFQRNSTDHKARTPQQIVVDYLSGQLLGSILLFKPYGSNKKWVVDGRHRITHLKSFLDGKLTLTHNEARDFWTLYLKQIQFLVDSPHHSVEMNKLIQALFNPKSNKEGSKVYPSVDFTKLPAIIKDEILNGIKLDLNEISVSVEDVYGNDLLITDFDKEKIDKIIWRKFTRMNFNSGKITVDDSIWNLPIEYAENSSNLASNATLKSFFGLNPQDMDETKKLNELMFTMMLFLDKKFTWGGSTKMIITNSHKPIFQNIDSNSRMFFSIFNGSISNGFGRMFSRGEILDLPSDFKSIKGGNKTNIKQLILFMFLLHTKSTGNLYADTPTHFHRNVLVLGSKIIKTCVFDKHGNIPTELLSQNNLQKVYEENRLMFHQIAEYRKNQRKHEDVISLYNQLVELCISIVY